MRALLIDAFSHPSHSMSICPRNSSFYDQSLRILLHSIIVGRVPMLNLSSDRGKKTEPANPSWQRMPRAEVKGAIYRSALDIVHQADVETTR